MSNTSETIYLNHATSSELGRIEDISHDDVKALIAGRPYGGWDDVKRSGVSSDSMKTLQRAKVEFGAPMSGPIGAPGSGGSGGSGAGNLGRA